MKNKILFAVLAAVILIPLAGCGQMQTAQCEKSKTADTSSASVTSDTEASDDAAVENSSSAVDSEITTEKETTVPAPESTSKVSTQNTAQPSVSAKQDTQKRNLLRRKVRKLRANPHRQSQKSRCLQQYHLMKQPQIQVLQNLPSLNLILIIG